MVVQMHIRKNEQNELRIVGEDGRTLYDGINVRLDYSGNFHNTLSLHSSGEWILTTLGEVTVAQCDNVSIECKREGDGFLVRTSFTNTSVTRLSKMIRLIVLGGRWREAIDRCLYNEFSIFNGNVCNEMESTIQTAKLMPELIRNRFSGARTPARLPVRVRTQTG
jgi:hypothetical protein